MSGRCARRPNPVLLLHTGEVLSDLLSAVLVQLAVALCWRLPGGSPRGGDDGERLSLVFVRGAAIAVRPANAVVAAALALVWADPDPPLARTAARRASAVAAAAAGLILPLIPQLLINWLSSGRSIR